MKRFKYLFLVILLIFMPCAFVGCANDYQSEIKRSKLSKQYSSSNIISISSLSIPPEKSCITLIINSFSFTACDKNRAMIIAA